MLLLLKGIRHCVIFPGGPPPSILTAVIFNYRVRNGSTWNNYAIKHLIQKIISKLNQAFGLLVYLS